MINTISQWIPSQFPRFYQESDPTFLAFVQSYYQWLETPDNPLYLSQNIYGIKDIDQTLDRFLIYFKQKYLRDIQLDTSANIKTIIKHALDIYRSKGSPQEIELLFQLIYQVPVDIYYPSTDLFRLSDGVWYTPTYLELTLSPYNVNLEQKEIKGVSSGAVAFIDRVIRTTVKGRLIDIAFISALTKDFQVSEKIIPTDSSLDVNLCPVILGSLSEISITSATGTGLNYNIGDLVPVTSATGEGGLIRVSNTTDSFGYLDIKFEDGGYGFANTAKLYVSNNVFTVNNATFTNTSYYYQFLDTVTQPMANLAYTSLTGGHFITGGNVYTYYANNSVMGTGVVMDVDETTAANGFLLVVTKTGSLSNNIYTVANAVHATKVTFTDISANGYYIGMDSVVSLYLSSGVGPFIPGETIGNGTGSTATVVSLVPSYKLLTVNNVKGAIQTGQTITGATSGTTDSVTSVSLTIGVSNNLVGFVSTGTNFIISNNMTGGGVTRVYNGSGAVLSYANTSNLLDTEVIALNTDLIGGSGSQGPYLSLNINAAAYGFPAAPTANLANVIGTTLSYNAMTIGKIKNILVGNTGSNYDHTPIIVVDQTEIVPYDIQDYVLDIVATGGFAVGEIVYQGNSDPTANVGRGIVKAGSNNSILLLQNLKFGNSITKTVNTSTIIYGSTSFTSANVISVSYDSSSQPMGRNTLFTQGFTGGNGSITQATLVDSGYGFLQGQDLSLANGGVVTAVLQHQGTHRGYYKEKGGFLSDQKKLFDGDYWQNYSYEIISPIMRDKYFTMLKQLGHPAGTKMFGRFRHISVTGEDKTISTGSITIAAGPGIHASTGLFKTTITGTAL